MRQTLLTLLLTLSAATSLSASAFVVAPALPPECAPCRYAAEPDLAFTPLGAMLSGLNAGNSSGIVRTAVGLNDELESYNAQGAGQLNIGSSFLDVFFDVSLESITHGNRPDPTGSFPAEMPDENLAGFHFPVLVRDSPTLQPLGQGGVQTVPGGFRVESFSDVFTEISLDGGQNGIPQDGPPTRFSITDLPEPSIVGLGLLGLLGLAACGWVAFRRPIQSKDGCLRRID